MNVRICFYDAALEPGMSCDCPFLLGFGLLHGRVWLVENSYLQQHSGEKKNIENSNAVIAGYGFIFTPFRPCLR